MFRSIFPVPREALATSALLLAFAPQLAQAQASGTSAGRASASAGVAAAKPALPLTVWVDSRGAAFDRARLRASLAQELGREVALTDDAGAAAVQIRLDGATRADVSYTTPSGERLSRSVDLPPDRERSLQVVSWLTVNLVRDEAAELLSELRARRKDEAAARDAEAQAAADKAAADKAAADEAAADKAAADRAAAERAAAEQRKAEQAQRAANTDAGSPNRGENDGLLRDPWRSLDVALATPLSLLRDSPRRELKLQLALGYGDAGGVAGGTLSSVALRVRRNVLGGAVAPVFALVGSDARGGVISGGYSQVGGSLTGVQLSGGLAVQKGKSARGALVAGGAVIAGDVTGGVVVGGILNARSLSGVAIAGGLNVIHGPSTGFMLGGVNFSGTQSGLEIAAGLNTADELHGLALAPLNLHRRVKGLQLGIVNIAEEVDGAAIGVISLAKNGHLQPTLWTSLDGSVHVALKSIAGYAFTQVGGGIDLNAKTFGYDGGVGAHLALTQNLFFEPGLHYSARSETANADGAPDSQRLYYLAQFGYRVGGKVDFLGAGGVCHTVSGSGARFAPELRAGIAFF